MIDTTVGLNVEQMRDFARTMDTAGRRLSSARTAVDRSQSMAWWKGSDAERFRLVWARTLGPRLQAEADALALLAGSLRRQLEEQIVASGDSATVIGGLVGEALSTAAKWVAPAVSDAKGIIDALFAPTPWSTGKDLMDKDTDPATMRQVPRVADYGGPEVDRYRKQAYKNAGIDGKKWDPSKGFEANRAFMLKSWAYYGKLYAQRGRFQWAGMANLVAPGIYGGMRSLNGSIGEMSQMTDVLDELVDMQKRIFDDLAWQHEAYLSGGIAEMRRLNQTGQLSDALLHAWTLIDTGDEASVRTGNELLLYREQKYVIGEGYANIAATTNPELLDIVAKSSIPGTPAFKDASGNITNFDDRWDYIKRGLLPVYQKMTRKEILIESAKPIWGRSNAFHESFKDQIVAVGTSGENFVDALAYVGGEITDWVAPEAL